MTTYKTLQQFPGYRFGDDGSVWSRRNFQGGSSGPWRKLKPKRQRSGHLSVCLRHDGATLTRWVHRLVLESFVGPCPPGMECRHLNGTPSDNRLQNIAWGSLGDNRRDRNTHGIWNKGDAHPMAKLTAAQVAVLRARRKAGATQRQLARQFGVSQGYVSQLLSGKYRA